MIQYDFDESFGYLVHNASHAIEQALNEELRQHGITFRQWQVIACLTLLGENCSQGDVAERLGIEGATLVGVLDRMERDGWIRRHPCATDRRKKIVRATEKVEPVWATMVECGHKIRRRATQGIPKRDYEIAWKVLERVLGNLTDPKPTQPLALANAAPE